MLTRPEIGADYVTMASVYFCDLLLSVGERAVRLAELLRRERRQLREVEARVVQLALRFCLLLEHTVQCHALLKQHFLTLPLVYLGNQSLGQQLGASRDEFLATLTRSACILIWAAIWRVMDCFWFSSVTRIVASTSLPSVVI